MKGVELLIHPDVILDYDAQVAIVSYLNQSKRPCFNNDEGVLTLFDIVEEEENGSK